MKHLKNHNMFAQRDSKIFALLFFSLTTFCVFAQKLPISIESAILKQRQFSPKSLNALQWLKDKTELNYISDDGSKLMSIDALGLNAEILKLEELNSVLNLSLKRLPLLTWTSPTAFYFQMENSFYSFDLIQKTGNKILSFNSAAENIDFHFATNKVAYTIGKNLLFADSKNDSISITKIKSDQDFVCGQSIARSEFGISKGTFWSPSGKLLAFYQKNESEVADYPLLDINVVPGQLKSIKYPMAGQKSESAKIGVYNLQTKRTIYLKVSGEKDQYLTNLAWDPNEKFVYVVVVNREQNHIWLNQYNANDGNFIKTLLEEEHPKYVEPEHPVWFIPAAENEFLWMSERDNFKHLYHYNIKGELLGQLTKGKINVESILGYNKESAELIFSAYDESGLNLHAYSVSLKKKGDINRLTDTDGIHNLSLSSDATKLLDNYSNLTTARKIRVIDLKNKNESISLLESDNPLKEFAETKIQIKSLMAEDGTLLQSRIILPSNFDSTKKYPVIVYVYGGPHAQMVTNSWIAGAPLWMLSQAEKGYIIFTLDNRGSAHRGLEFENVIHRQLGTVEIEDQMIGVNYLKSLNYVDSTKMAVHGWSFGGFMTISMMLRTPDVFKVGVAGGPVTDWKYYEVMYGERYMDKPEENPEGYKKAALHHYVKNLKGDLLMIHGTVDDVVLEQHSLSLIKSFVENGILVDYFTYPMHAHNVLGKDRLHLMRKVLSYIEDKLN
jgi:dipeptidyl-peptidase 4